MNKCADEPLPPHLPVTDLLIIAPSIDEATRLGMIIKRAGVTGLVVNVRQGPIITVLVGHQAPIPIFWPKATTEEGKAPDKSKNKDKGKLKP